MRGLLKLLRDLYNTGGYTEPAPSTEQPGSQISSEEQVTAVPLRSPSETLIIFNSQLFYSIVRCEHESKYLSSPSIDASLYI